MCARALHPQRGEGEACGTPLEDEDGNQSGYMRNDGAAPKVFIVPMAKMTEPTCAPTIALGGACEAYDDDACGDAFCINEIRTDQLLDDGAECIDDTLYLWNV